MSLETLSEKDKTRLFHALDEIRRLAKMETDLLRILVHSKCEKAVSMALPSEKKRFAYQHSDGELSSRQVGEIAGVSHNTVSSWWREWAGKGMGESVLVQGGGRRFKAKYALLELAVAVLEGDVTPD